ncbi:baseplate J/gp47 family protein [Streptomyces sp. NPDC004134]|uniref:baseplate J/gp47 family protein n=1 Tax=Streptomyces sp. NPDC004134 TaxID=3364691 RepID=UPI0036C02DDE
MTYGVTDEGFVLKGIDQLLAESRARARTAFGDDVDLGPAGPLGKILEVVAAEDSELWKRLEDLFYAQFPATATGPALDLLGDDAGLPRRAGRRTGQVRLTLGGGAPNRPYVVPEGTLLLTAPPPDDGSPPARAFATEQPAVLTLAAPQATVDVRAVEPDDEPVAAEAVTRIHPEHMGEYLADWAGATLTLSNPAPFAGPLPPEDDVAYRARLIALPHALWTPDSVRQAALGIEDVVDARVTDELGGLDVSQVFFDGFDFGERVFSAERRIGEPYFAEVAVAHRGPRPWLTTSGPDPVTGVRDLVAAAVERVRPIGVYVNVVEADHIEVAVRAEVAVDPRFVPAAVDAGIRARLAHDIGSLRLGDDVLYARVMCALVDEPGVTDVRNLHLRRCPPAFGRFGFGTVPYQTEVMEAPVGESLAMGLTEMALFTRDSDLTSIEVVSR